MIPIKTQIIIVCMIICLSFTGAFVTECCSRKELLTSQNTNTCYLCKTDNPFFEPRPIKIVAEKKGYVQYHYVNSTMLWSTSVYDINTNYTRVACPKED